MKIQSKLFLAAAVAAACAGTASAAVSPEEAKQLGDTLTPWGAIKAGNKEGTIPAYTGPLKPPANYDRSKPGYRPDPFANEKALFVIDGKNYTQYADKLTEGVKAMFQKYPNYRIDVYPSHRVVNNPKLFNDNAIKNATACKTSEDGSNLIGCWAGTPFPIPKNGAEVMWNRLLKYDGHALFSKGANSWVVDTNGSYSTAGRYDFWMLYPIFSPSKTTVIGSKDVYEKIRLDFDAPARKAGEKLVVHDNIDMIDPGRRAWQYLPGQRRVKLSPDISYDTPSPTGGGAATVDDSALFYGAIDRYDWKLIGKKEMYIPYNTYKARDPNVCSSKVILTKSFVNPDCVRWELHRVWVVEGNLKAGKRHIYPKRTYYWDEDLPGVGMADNYDAAGKIYRVSLPFPIVLYDGEGASTDEWVTYDMATGIYTYQETVTDTGGWVFTPPKSDSFFSPEALAGEGVR
jgi:hypothetical protein